MLISTVGIGDTVVSETLGMSDPGGLCSVGETDVNHRTTQLRDGHL